MTNAPCTLNLAHAPPHPSSDAGGWQALLAPPPASPETRIAHPGLAAAWECLETAVMQAAEAAALRLEGALTPANAPLTAERIAQLISVNQEMREFAAQGQKIFHLAAQLAAHAPASADGSAALTDILADIYDAIPAGQRSSRLERCRRLMLTELQAWLTAADRIAPAPALDKRERGALLPLPAELADYGRVLQLPAAAPRSALDAALLAIRQPFFDIALDPGHARLVPLSPLWQDQFGLDPAALAEAAVKSTPAGQAVERCVAQCNREIVAALPHAQLQNPRAGISELIQLRRDLHVRATAVLHELRRLPPAAIDHQAVLDALAGREASWPEPRLRALLDRCADLHRWGSALPAGLERAAPAGGALPLCTLEAVDGLSLAAPAREQLCSELSQITERNAYLPNDPRLQDFGGTVCRLAPHFINQLLEEGAGLTVCRSPDGRLLGYSLFLHPDQAEHRWPRLPIRYAPYGQAAFIYFIVCGESARGLPLYELLLNGAAVQQKTADVMVGLVAEDNERGLIVHAAVGGGQLYPGDWKYFISDLPGAKRGGEAAAETALGMVFGASPRWREAFAESRPSRREAVEQAAQVVACRLAGVFPDDIATCLRALRKAQLRDIYLTALLERDALLTKALKLPLEQSRLPTLPIDCTNASFSENTLGLLDQKVPLIQRLRTAFELTLTAQDLDEAAASRLWERLARGEAAAPLLSPWRAYLARTEQRADDARNELIYSVWDEQDALIRRLNSACRGRHDFTPDVYFLGVDEWPQLLSRLAAFLNHPENT